MDISSNPGVPSLAEGLGSPPLHSTSSTPEEINLPTPSDPSLGLRRSSRLRNMSDKPLPQLSAIAEEFITPVRVHVSLCSPIKLTFNSVMASHNPERDDWLLAMKDEMASIEGHGTWLLTKPVPGKKVLSGRWILLGRWVPLVRWSGTRLGLWSKVSCRDLVWSFRRFMHLSPPKTLLGS